MNFVFFSVSVSMSFEEVVNIIKSLKGNKVCGCDCILNEQHKESFEILTGHIIVIGNSLFGSGCFP